MSGEPYLFIADNVSNNVSKMKKNAVVIVKSLNESYPLEM